MAKVTPEVGVKISANVANFLSGLNQASNSLKGFENKLKNTFSPTGALGQALAGFSLYQVGSEIINTTSQFERFEAVLTNTLGDNSKAKQALNNISEFAATTPFQVEEITAAYVRWANMGLDPTIDRMRKIGDVAASTGAGFEQTAEAFKDLMVGQTKRIEEVGISAQQANGKIQLSFKGLNIEIEKNAQGVQRALDIYSQMNGVLGTQDQLSKRLGGKISNLKDSWTLLMNELGQNNKGVLMDTVQLLGALVNSLRDLNQFKDILLFNPFAQIGSNKELDILKSSGKWPSGDIAKLNREELTKILTSGVQFFRDQGKGALGPALDPLDKRGIKYILGQAGKAYKEFAKILKDNNYTIDETNILWNTYRKNALDIFNQLVKNIEAEKARKKAEEEAAAREAEIQNAKEYTAFLQEKEIQRKEYILQLNKYEQEDLKRSIEQNKRFNETLRERLALSNAGISAEMAGMQNPETGKLLKPAGMQQQVDNAKAALSSLNEETEKQKISIDDLNQSFANAAKGGLLDFAFGLEDVFKGEIKFGDNILRALAGFLQEFGKQLIVLGTGQIAMSKVIQSMFSGNPISGAAAVAAGVAMMAIGGAVQSNIKSRMQKLSETSGSTDTSNFRRSNEIVVTGQLVGSGRDLVAVINNTQFDNSIRRGG